MKRAVQNPSVARAARSIASDSTSVRRSADPSLADKFNLAALNGGKSPFEVSSNSLLRSTSVAATSPAPKMAPPSKVVSTHKSEKQVKDIYSLEYLLGGDRTAASTAATATTTTSPVKTKESRNPFDVASAKLM